MSSRPAVAPLNHRTLTGPGYKTICRLREGMAPASFSKRGFEGAPDVVVEILSPTTRGNDVFLKEAAYARLGVAEYWIVDPDLGRVEVFHLPSRLPTA